MEEEEELEKDEEEPIDIEALPDKLTELTKIIWSKDREDIEEAGQILVNLVVDACRRARSPIEEARDLIEMQRGPVEYEELVSLIKALGS